MRKPRSLELDLTGARVLTTRIPVLPAAPRTLPFGTHEITIPRWRPVTLNELFALHHLAAARKKRGDRELIAAYAQRAGVPPATTKRRVSIAVTLAGRMKQTDPDALWKSTLDGLTAARMLVDDSPDWVELGSMTQRGGDEKATTIRLEDLS